MTAPSSRSSGGWSFATAACSTRTRRRASTWRARSTPRPARRAERRRCGWTGKAPSKASRSAWTSSPDPCCSSAIPPTRIPSMWIQASARPKARSRARWAIRSRWRGSTSGSTFPGRIWPSCSRSSGFRCRRRLPIGFPACSSARARAGRSRKWRAISATATCRARSPWTPEASVRRWRPISFPSVSISTIWRL